MSSFGAIVGPRPWSRDGWSLLLARGKASVNVGLGGRGRPVTRPVVFLAFSLAAWRSRGSAENSATLGNYSPPESSTPTVEIARLVAGPPDVGVVRTAASPIPRGAEGGISACRSSGPVSVEAVALRSLSVGRWKRTWGGGLCLFNAACALANCSSLTRMVSSKEAAFFSLRSNRDGIFAIRRSNSVNRCCIVPSDGSSSPSPSDWLSDGWSSCSSD